MSLTSEHNKYTTVQTLDGRRIRVDNHSGEIEEIAFDSLDNAPLAVLNPQTDTLPVSPLNAPPLGEAVADLATLIRGKKFQSKNSY